MWNAQDQMISQHAGVLMAGNQPAGRNQLDALVGLRLVAILKIRQYSYYFYCPIIIISLTELLVMRVSIVLLGETTIR